MSKSSLYNSLETDETGKFCLHFGLHVYKDEDEHAQGSGSSRTIGRCFYSLHTFDGRLDLLPIVPHHQMLDSVDTLHNMESVLYSLFWWYCHYVHPHPLPHVAWSVGQCPQFHQFPMLWTKDILTSGLPSRVIDISRSDHMRSRIYTAAIIVYYLWPNNSVHWHYKTCDSDWFGYG